MGHRAFGHFGCVAEGHPEAGAEKDPFAVVVGAGQIAGRREGEVLNGERERGQQEVIRVRIN